MLNTFPDLLNFSFIAPFILRVVIGSYFIKQAYIELKVHKKRVTNIPNSLRIISAFGGILLIVGFLTQITSFVLILIVAIGIIKRIYKNKLEEDKLDFYILLIAILITLLITGAGFCAIDLPL